MKAEESIDLVKDKIQKYFGKVQRWTYSLETIPMPVEYKTDPDPRVDITNKIIAITSQKQSEEFIYSRYQYLTAYFETNKWIRFKVDILDNSVDIDCIKTV